MKTGLVSRNPTGSGTAWYAFDQCGNVAQRVNGSGGLLSTNVYDAYGQKRSGPADVFGFGGQAGDYTDAETGLVLCTNRFYDPQQGRFLTRDPIGSAGGVNLYSYTQNNPGGVPIKPLNTPTHRSAPTGYLAGALVLRRFRVGRLQFRADCSLPPTPDAWHLRG